MPSRLKRKPSSRLTVDSCTGFGMGAAHTEPNFYPYPKRAYRRYHAAGRISKCSEIEQGFASGASGDATNSSSSSHRLAECVDNTTPVVRCYRCSFLLYQNATRVSGVSVS